MGTTRLEFVTSGRSVAISSLAVGHVSADASTAPKTANAESKNIWKVRLLTETLIDGTIELAKAIPIGNYSLLRLPQERKIGQLGGGFIDPTLCRLLARNGPNGPVGRCPFAGVDRK
jgi:hypothetical protein